MTLIDRHLVTAQGAGYPLESVSGTVTIDEGWAPYGQLDLVCPIPTQAVLDALDPRKGARLELTMLQEFGEADRLSTLSEEWAGLTLAGVSALYAGQFLSGMSAAHFEAWNSFGIRPSPSRYFNLSIRSRRLNHGDNTMTITAATDEALLQDYALVNNAPYVAATSSVRAAVVHVLGRIGAYLTAGTADGTIEVDASIWLPGVTAWDYLTPLVQAAGLRLWCDELRQWHLDSTLTATPGQVQLSATGTLTAADDEISRDGTWFDAVIITYEWDDAAGVTQRRYDTAVSPGYRKALALTYQTVYPGPGAAARVLARATGRGRTFDVTAVSSYDVTPGMAATITVPVTPTQTGFVSAVAWSWPDHEMNVTTRGLIDTPPTAWVFTPAGISWASIPAGTSWATYQYTEPQGA